MSKPDFYWWRAFPTGMCFAVFGVGALLLGLVVFPVLLVVIRDEASRRRRVRTIVHHSFRHFYLLMNRVGCFTYEVIGSERLGRPGQLIIANHPTLIDVVMIIGLTSAGCVVKEALFRNPFMRRVVRSAGYISNGSTSVMIQHAAAALRSGDTLVVFPEGTRSQPGQPPEFHRGAASIAVQAAAVLTPIFITTDPEFLPKNRPWYRVPRSRPHLTVRVGDDVDLSDYRSLSPPKASRLLNHWLQEHYARVLGEDGRYNAAMKAHESNPAGTMGSQITKKDLGVRTS